ncbi:MAG: methylenetetrahydrofolate--tRNA-(uracil(54)-C(5))-methyltransferase (FADH(2)-oxidizing) TrmFO [Holophagales bacterium]|jgi:methylenetetrahydrofolate--tRNA-(uracil-5-)-methyltransferase|nr:methylenetetrahydrofolate--tRNA-(uracil(54)-C(5))-methyltransferase (FADH(2)-oxidizing) TrmFO [Holophagales bacterium]
MTDVCVIGAGLAGSEAAWQLAERGHKVLLCEMRPENTTPAHQTGYAAEMVCSNSFKSDDPCSATGILKAEMERLGSIILATARETSVPAGLSLAVDRNLFAGLITERLQKHGNIEWKTALATEPPIAFGIPTIIASGPLTADPLALWISETFNESSLYFYDAIAPIVEKDSIDPSIAFPASRYGKRTPDFLNCPLNKEQYETFVDVLLAAPRAPLHDLEARYFEACLPIEVMAERGRDTLRYGPMKPVGLTDPKTGRQPYAVVQLRQDSIAGDLFNLVGFQTRLAWGAQAEVFRLIPGIGNAVFSRFGSIHRNTYISAPRLLDATLAVKNRPDLPGLYFAGQISGVEGYMESAATGLAAAIAVDRHIRSLPPLEFPGQTMIGAMLHYLANAAPVNFTPINAMIGVLPDLPKGVLDLKEMKKRGGKGGLKAAKREALREIALAAIKSFESVVR